MRSDYVAFEYVSLKVVTLGLGMLGYDVVSSGVHVGSVIVCLGGMSGGSNACEVIVDAKS